VFNAAGSVNLIVDVGTNAEIVLGNRERLLAASSPTGPAFEGAQISCGQRAAPGAVERVPGRLIGDAGGLGAGGDAAFPRDGLQQANAIAPDALHIGAFQCDRCFNRHEKARLALCSLII